MDSGLDNTQRGTLAGTRPRWKHGHAVLIALIAVKVVVVASLFLIGSPHAKWALTVLFAMLAVDAFVSFGRWRAARDSRPSPTRPGASNAPLGELSRRAGISTAMRIGAVLAFGGVLAASLALDLRYLGIGALVAFPLVALFSGPSWLAAIGDEEQRASDGPTLP